MQGRVTRSESTQRMIRYAVTIPTVTLMLELQPVPMPSVPFTKIMGMTGI